MTYKRKIYTVKFPEEHQLQGLEIKLKGLTISDMELLLPIQSMSNTRKKEGEGFDLEALDPLAQLLAKKIVSWNIVGVDNDGVETPIPVSIDSIRDMDLNELLPAIEQWMETAAGVDSPLKKISSSGVTSPEVGTIPMTDL
jgi:hypothetical protein